MALQNVHSYKAMSRRIVFIFRREGGGGWRVAAGLEGHLLKLAQIKAQTLKHLVFPPSKIFKILMHPDVCG